jgi:hypothetical protein
MAKAIQMAEQGEIDNKRKDIADYNQRSNFIPRLNPLDVHVQNWNIFDVEERRRQLSESNRNAYYPPHPDPRQIENPYAFAGKNNGDLSFRAPQVVPN